MADYRDVSIFSKLCSGLVAFLLVVFLPGAEAFDGGDVAALVIGLVVGILGICSCLGYYARRRGA